MSNLVALDHRSWTAPVGGSKAALDALERGDVLALPQLPFVVEPDEQRLFAVDLAGAAKNVSYTPSTGRVGGTNAAPADVALLGQVLARFSGQAESLARALLPEYGSRLVRARASFRPAEIENRATSWRKDDTRLHVDSFPASPTGGRRILRVFTNVNPRGRPRTWRIGPPFESVVERFRHLLKLPWRGQSALLYAVRLTKTRRSMYDALMLQLHDRMKADASFQSGAPQQMIEFVPGTTWIAFTDEVSHAAMAGQYQLEQTFLVPVAAMRDERAAPLRVLERSFGRRLA